MYFYTNIIYFSFDFFFFTYSDDEEEKVNGVYIYIYINGNELALNQIRKVIQNNLQSKADTTNYNMSEWKKKLQMGG